MTKSEIEEEERYSRGATDVAAADDSSPTIRDQVREANFRRYIQEIAQARYVMRKVLRIVNEQAQEHGLDPLTHQALLQIYGTDQSSIAATELAKRLDIAPAFASRIITSLEKRGYVSRSSSARDKRVKDITTTPAGIELLRRVDRAAFDHISFFHREFNDREKRAALSVFAFYVGLESSTHASRAVLGM